MRVKRSDSEPGCEQTTSNSDNHGSASNSLYEQPTVVEGIQDKDIETDSESDEDEDNLEHEKDPVDLRNVNLEEKSLSSVSNASDSNDSEQNATNKSFSSTYQSEDETDGSSDHRSPATTIYR